MQNYYKFHSPQNKRLIINKKLTLFKAKIKDVLLKKI